MDIVQYLQHGCVPKTNVETQFPTLNLSRHVPLTNMPISVVDRVSFNNLDSTILARQSGVRQRVASEIPGSTPVHNSTKRAREEDTEDLNQHCEGVHLPPLPISSYKEIKKKKMQLSSSRPYFVLQWRWI